MKKERPASGPGSRQPQLKLPTVMPDGTKIKMHPLLYLMRTSLHDNTKSDLARHMGVRPQSLYKWESRCAADRNFPLPAARAAQIGAFFDVAPGVLRPDVFGGAQP